MADWRGRKVIDDDGAKVGKLESVYLDRATDEPKWGLAKTGLFGARKLVPLREASSTGSGIQLPVSKKMVSGAPRSDPGEELSPRQESELSEHYGLGDGVSHEGRGEGPADRSGESRPSPAQDSPSEGVGERGAARQHDREQREQFGGFQLGAALFGWLVAVGIGVLLTALAGAITGLVGAGTGAPAPGSAGTAAIVSAVIVLIVLAIAYYAGGYVAGRMARFNGPKQGLGVWLIGVLATLLLAGIGALLGAQYNVLAQLNLPSISLDSGSLTIGGLIALAAILIGTLAAAMGGGKAGTRYHRKVDRAGLSG